MALSLLECGGYDPDHLWKAWGRWASTAADVGITTRHALSFDHWSEVRHHDPARTASNEALMRAFPLALATLRRDHDEARRVVLHQAVLSHAHPDAGWGAWVAVAMMRAAIDGGDPFGVIDAELQQMPTEVADRFATVLRPDWTPDDAEHDNGSVWACLAQAVWAVRPHAGFETAVTAAVDLGDDADTVACVTGALAGAMYGIQAISSRWGTYVHGHVPTDSGSVRLDGMALQHLGLRLLGGTAEADQASEHPKVPVEVAPGLHADFETFLDTQWP